MKAIPEFFGIALINCLNASNPPAEAPTPTTQNRFLEGMVSSFSIFSLPLIAVAIKFTLCHNRHVCARGSCSLRLDFTFFLDATYLGYRITYTISQTGIYLINPLKLCKVTS